VVHQPVQALLAAPDGHLQGVQGQVGAQPAGGLPATRKRLKASMTKATWTKPDQEAT
jgi:hypothetical protein